MQLLNFRADAHASGGRIDLSWEFHPQSEAERAALQDGLPQVVVRRKARDFAYPLAVPDDPFQAYDGATFTAQLTLPPRFDVQEGRRLVEVVEADPLSPGDDSRLLERRWTTTYRDLQGRLLFVQVQVADRGHQDAGLEPGTVYYYQVFGDLVPTVGNLAPYRATAQATAAYGLGEDLYRRLPAIHQRLDEEGELRRFVSLFGDQLDLLRSLAEALPGQHNVDSCDYRLLPLMADWVGWDLNFAAPIPLRRHEIKYASALYRITGTVPGSMIWVKRLTGWEAEVKEFYRNVLFSNDLGNPDDPGDRGSRTVDTSDPQLLARIRSAADDLDYTYDTGTSDQDWYAYNCVGIFVQPNPGETVSTALRKRANLVNSLNRFLPVNIRGVVILETDSLADVQSDTLNLLGASGDEPPN